MPNNFFVPLIITYYLFTIVIIGIVYNVEQAFMCSDLKHKHLSFNSYTHVYAFIIFKNYNTIELHWWIVKI